MKLIDDAAGNELPPGDVGEIAIRGPNVMKGYWNRPDATAEVLKREIPTPNLTAATARQ